ncbi:hypothetical protein AQUCO_01700178v1 [Aquilegia coerulea]|uniref:UspA domain-containing protein n=1 Tax=Aquilegia coerulea TaxID=218851 RepID=A0A2G5DLM6_AQUCA|nr:hypothetical protein AQUCO_01700178v1 [Aquilegia coerulea]
MAEGKPVMIVGIDDSEHSFYALEWTLDRFFPSSTASDPPYKLMVIHARPLASATVGIAGPGAADVYSYVELNLKKAASHVIEKAKDLCEQRSLTDVSTEVIEGDARNVMCEAVDKHHATILVLGSHGYGALKRVFLGSVSDHCAHHAHCSVMIVKKPKTKH